MKSENRMKPKSTPRKRHRQWKALTDIGLLFLHDPHFPERRSEVWMQ